MLVLTRKIGEEIVIAGNIRVRIIRIDGGKVRIGIVAPDDVSVDREEVHDRRASTDWALIPPVSVLIAGPDSGLLESVAL
jgi:carbon storage regulator CsrA